MKVQSKKDSFFIHTKRKPTNVIKVSNYYDSKRNYSSEWEFVIIKNGLISDVDDNYYDRSLPIISFEEWQILPDFPKPEYDPKDVAFKIVPVSELEEVKPKKIIGYKLIKPEYWESVSIITGIVNLESDTEEQKKKYVIDWMKHDNFGFARKLREAGVLDIWFKPVYQKETITLKSGVKLSEEDIAEVKEILNNK